ncbi:MULTISPECIES: carboxypeptidase-like regulatory domain-containing protein [unclassified Roseivirga]|uniref:carboxypeptidase-like regulatory domain-containing protein n=1 Tax=unclassified Roseivirga TaxID=2626142 RepID=UPI00257AA066|nr:MULTISPECIES: carboxypeptidase-like regulatory domain-containing protein [unclassified Roseivirga]MEC7754968.1 carboxypeptidase-like regulatory domain-containing protein [Bacteroidota bacterium]
MRIISWLLCVLICSQISLAQDIRSVAITENFDNASLAKVLRILKNKYDLKIAYDDALITGTTVSGQFAQKPVTEFLDAILRNKGIDYQLLNDKIILIPKKVNLDVNTPSLFDITVFGLVQDASTGESLPNAVVRVSGLQRGVITNKDGYFSLPQVPTDTSTIEVSYLGYQKSQVKLKPGETKQTIKIMMQESSLDLSEFTVVENKFSTVKYGDQISQITIDPNNLSALPSLGELDIFRSLQYLPGIGGSDETSSALSIRNSPSTHNLVLFDGITLYRLDHFFGVFSAINADAVRDIKIYKGGFGAEYGGRVSGVVDITGTTGSFNEPNYSMGLNLLSARFSANVPFASGRGAFHVSARRAYTDIIRSNLFEKLYTNYRKKSNQVNQQAFNGLANEDDLIRPDFHFYDLNFKATYKVSTRDVMSLSVYQGRDDLDTDFDIVNFQDPNNPGTISQIDSYNEKADWGNNGIGLAWSRNWNRKYYSNLQLAFSDHYFDYFYNNERRNGAGDQIGLYEITRMNEVEDLQLNLKNELTVGGRHSLDFGINLSSINVFNKVDIRDLSGMTPDDRNPSSDGTILSFYLADNITLSKNLELRLGGRLNTTSVSDKSFFGQRAALVYQPLPHLELKLSSGKYFQIMREEVFDDPFSNNENSWNLAYESSKPGPRHLPVMESDHLIAGFQYEKNDLTIDLEFYEKQVSGLTEYNISHLYNPNTNRQSPSILIAPGTSNIRGLDLLIQKRIGPYQGWIAYTRSKALNRFESINNNSEIAAREDQRNELKFVHIIELPAWNFSATWVYGSGKPFYRPTINFIRNNQGELINFEVVNTQKTVERLPDYHRLDISIAHKFEGEHMRGEMGLSILNVYNRQNIQGRRLKRDEIEMAINNNEQMAPTNLYRDIVLLDFTPSLFLNLYF